MYETISRRRKLYEIVVDQIIGLIQSRELKVGDKLPSERELAEELGISRTVLRESLKALEERELIEVHHGSGAYIRSPSIGTIGKSVSLILSTDPGRYLDLMDLRTYLDVEIAGRLAEHATNEDVAAMEAAIEKMWNALESPEKFCELDVAFHMAFYKATKNELLIAIMAPVTELLMEAMQLTFETPGNAERSLKRHQALLACIKAHDARAARQTMQGILSRGKEHLQESLKST